MKDALITVDGPLASGKSSLCARLAGRWPKWDWLSTGIFYRGLAYMILDQNLNKPQEWVQALKKNNWSVKKQKDKTCFFYRDQDITSKIYNHAMDVKASEISAQPLVREALAPSQRRQKEKGRGLIAEGRDCGTVIFPEAPLKIYLTARALKRAKRRAHERGQELTSVVIGAQKQRDRLDLERDCAPLRKPQSAWLIDTEKYSLDDIEKIVNDRVHLEFPKWV